MSRSHAVVIGGGVIGVCSAYYLARAGRDVTLVERGDICSGCSYGNGGLIVPSHSIPLAAPGAWLQGLRWMLNPESPFYIKPPPSRELIAWLWRFRRACNMTHVRRAMPVIRDLSYGSLALFRELAAIEGFGFGYRQDGTLAVLRTESGYDDAVKKAHLLGEVGISTKILDGAETRRLEPSLLPGVVGGILFPDDAHIIPDVFVKGLAGIAERMGIQIRLGTEVLGFRTEGRRIVAVETTRGDIESVEVVLAAGAWSSQIAAGLQLHIPIQAAKGYGVIYPRLPNSPRIPLMLREARVGVTPMGNTLRFAGTLELAGLDFSIDRRRVAAIKRSAASYVAGLDALKPVEIWRGFR
ncbi:MAG TPA: FAD-dependent oxidoreductase, partial [Candidatus Acidoferrum sp.]|nr:FAD-dependent oxidoreductase [Candidatus Acidoferrum sp.]